MHRRKRSPLKQPNCLERDKAKMDSASCEINSKAAHLVRLEILRAEARNEWATEVLGPAGGRAAGGSLPAPRGGLRDVPCWSAALVLGCFAYNPSVILWVPQEWTLRITVQAFIGRCKEYE